MASVPLSGDRLTAKVDLVVYTDSLVKKQVPPIPPGPLGLRSTVQYPGTKKAGEEVGTYTGNISDEGFEVNYVIKYRLAQQGFWPGQWHYSDVIQQVKVWVRKTDVTGNWDKGVDAPKDDSLLTNPPPSDNTNTILAAAVGIAAFAKFILPNLRRNG